MSSNPPLKTATRRASPKPKKESQEAPKKSIQEMLKSMPVVDTSTLRSFDDCFADESSNKNKRKFARVDVHTQRAIAIRNPEDEDEIF